MTARRRLEAAGLWRRTGAGGASPGKGQEIIGPGENQEKQGPGIGQETPKDRVVLSPHPEQDHWRRM